jgi:hypothetical protein
MKAPVVNVLGAVMKGLKLHPWRGRTVVVRYRGSVMEQAGLRASFARDVIHLQAADVHAVIVHGGGPHIDALMRRLGKTPRFVDGLRINDEESTGGVLTSWVWRCSRVPALGPRSRCERKPGQRAIVPGKAARRRAPTDAHGRTT